MAYLLSSFSPFSLSPFLPFSLSPFLPFLFAFGSFALFADSYLHLLSAPFLPCPLPSGDFEFCCSCAASRGRSHVLADSITSKCPWSTLETIGARMTGNGCSAESSKNVFGASFQWSRCGNLHPISRLHLCLLYWLPGVRPTRVYALRSAVCFTINLPICLRIFLSIFM